MRSALLTVSIALLLILAGCSGADSGQDVGVSDSGSDVGASDYGGADSAPGESAGGASGSGSASGAADGGQAGSSDTVGVAVGGAQDANTFRRNVEEGYVPQPNTLTYEGLYHDYYFDTGREEACERLFCPSYSQAVARDPVSNETEQFVTVGLNSGLTQADFERQDLDLVVVVDTSGSMHEQFDEYHYDAEDEDAEDRRNQRKMAAAKQAIGSMTEHLGPDDRLGIVAYDSSARRVQELTHVDEQGRERTQERLNDLRADGGTNLDAGMRAARDMARNGGGEGRATRVIYVTDAMPNVGDTSGRSLENRLQNHAQEGIESTFVGVGVDFNADLAESISTVRGGNYYTVHSPEAFDERMDEGFQYMVTPLVYDLTLEVETEGYEIERVYGSPQADESTGQLMHVRTLFPSRSTSNGSEGSVVLVELDRTDAASDSTAALTTSYETPRGQERTVRRTIDFEERSAPYFESSGVRRAVVLTEYATLMRNWMSYERSDDLNVDADDSIEYRHLGQWEQQSVDLRVSSPYDDRIALFRPYFARHAEALGGDQFEDDLAVLERLDERAAAVDDEERGTEEGEASEEEAGA